jgi:hypothetical protein
MNDLESLKSSVDRLSKLLEDPQTGLFTWNEMVNDRLKEINSQYKGSAKKINWDNLRCEEASMFSKETYIPCGEPATSIIWHNKDKRSYLMCFGCADHNVKNRGGIELAAKDKEVIVIKTELKIKHEFDYKSDIIMLREFLRKFIGRYFKKGRELSDKDLKDASENKEILHILALMISGEFYEVKIEEK